MLIFPISNNLLLMFVALEVMSLPLYLMAGMARRRRLLSQEAAMKYFLLGAFASAFFLYGLALLYGYANSVDLPKIFAASADVRAVRRAALRRPGAAARRPAVQGGRRAVPQLDARRLPGLTDAGHRVHGVVHEGRRVRRDPARALRRVQLVGVDWRPIVWAVAIASMAVGALFGLTQTDVKRMLAYSSIAHAGFLLVALVAVSQASVSAVLFYLLTYGIATLAAFGLLMVVRDADGEATQLSQWSGLARKSPAGRGDHDDPAAVDGGHPADRRLHRQVRRCSGPPIHTAGPLVVIALICSAIAAFFYLRIVVVMYFAEPPENSPTVAIPGWSTTIALTFGVVVTVVLGVFPQPVLDLADKAANLVG